MVLVEGVAATDGFLNKGRIYSELVGIEAVLFLTHVVLLMFVEALLLCLLF